MSTLTGQTAPDIALPASNGQTVKLSDFKGKNVVLYFYPKDMTPGCTTEACDFRDRHTDFSELNTVILGVSPDPISKHEKFIEKHGLPFLLLADEQKELANAFDVWKLKKRTLEKNIWESNAVHLSSIQKEKWSRNGEK